jgi:hypothetical protein
MTGFRYLLSAATLLLASLAPAQTASDPEITVEDALHHMSNRAGVVFLGEVIAIRHLAGENGASGVVETDFRVDQAVRGCATGRTYTLREWAGLWTGGDQRYRIGQRLLMLLHTPGASGITSPVGGMAGAIPIRGSAIALQADASLSPAPQPVADLRWVGTRLQRPRTYRNLSGALATASDASAIATPGEASTAAQQASIAVVINMLAGWQKKYAR